MNNYNEETIADWSKKVAALGVDLLVDNGMIKKQDVELAIEIVAEEIRVRIVLGDYPPKESP